MARRIDLGQSTDDREPGLLGQMETLWGGVQERISEQREETKEQMLPYAGGEFSVDV